MITVAAVLVSEEEVELSAAVSAAPAAATRLSAVTPGRSNTASPVIRSSTLTKTVSGITTLSTTSSIIRSSTIEATGGSTISKYQSERIRLLNSGPLARYAYTSLLDGLGGDFASASDFGGGTAFGVVVDTSNKQTTTSDRSGNRSTTSFTLNRDSSDISSSVFIDPRAYSLSVPMDMFPKLSERHLRLPSGHRGSVVPVDWPANPCSVIAKGLSTSEYIDDLRESIELCRDAHIEQQMSSMRRSKEASGASTAASPTTMRSPSTESDPGTFLFFLFLVSCFIVSRFLLLFSFCSFFCVFSFSFSIIFFSL